MNRMLTIIGMTTLMLSFSLAIPSKEHTNNSVSHVQSEYENNFQGEINSGYTEYDAIKSSLEWENPYYNNSNDFRNTADTMSYCPSIGGQFVFVPGDFMFMAYQMPADGNITGVNVPVFQWADTSSASADGLEVSMYKLNYPIGSDGNAYSTSNVDGSGWMGYAWDGADHATAGIEGTEWFGDSAEEVGQCGGDAAMPNVADPLGEKIWPTGFSVASFGPSTVTGETDNWIATADFGGEPELMQGDWVGIVVENKGTMAEYTGFYYCEGEGVVDPWTFGKFYATECDGTGGETGWYIRHWLVHWPLAVELTGDRPPIFSDVSSLPTTLSTDARTVTAMITDDNPSGGASGVASATVNWSTSAGEAGSAAMTGDGDTYTGSIPGQSAGIAVTWWLSATDVEGGVTSTTASTYNIFAPMYDNLFVYNSGLFGSWISDYYLYGTSVNGPSDDEQDYVLNYDVWAYGSSDNTLFDNYTTIMEISGGGPSWCNDSANMDTWLDSGNKNYINAGDEWMGGCVDGWAPTTFVEGDFVYDHLGIAASHPDINYGASGDQGGISRLMAHADNPISGDLAAFLGDTLHLNYDPNYEIGAANWLDAADAVAGTEVAFTGYGGILDTAGAVDPEATMYNTGLYTSYENGNQTAWFGFDPLSLNTSPDYYWIGIADVGVLPSTLDWMGVELTMSNEQSIAIPNEVTLYQNYPNPFNPTTNIQFDISSMVDVNLSIYNALGQQVTELTNGQMQPGSYTMTWNGTDQIGNAASSGMYFYRLTAGEVSKTGKMILMK